MGWEYLHLDFSFTLIISIFSNNQTSLHQTPIQSRLYVSWQPPSAFQKCSHFFAKNHLRFPIRLFPSSSLVAFHLMPTGFQVGPVLFKVVCAKGHRRGDREGFTSRLGDAGKVTRNPDVSAVGTASWAGPASSLVPIAVIPDLCHPLCPSHNSSSPLNFKKDSPHFRKEGKSHVNRFKVHIMTCPLGLPWNPTLTPEMCLHLPGLQPPRHLGEALLLSPLPGLCPGWLYQWFLLSSDSTKSPFLLYSWLSKYSEYISPSILTLAYCTWASITLTN